MSGSEWLVPYFITDEARQRTVGGAGASVHADTAANSWKHREEETLPFGIINARVFLLLFSAFHSMAPAVCQAEVLFFFSHCDWQNWSSNRVSASIELSAPLSCSACRFEQRQSEMTIEVHFILIYVNYNLTSTAPGRRRTSKSGHCL